MSDACNFSPCFPLNQTRVWSTFSRCPAPRNQSPAAQSMSESDESTPLMIKEVPNLEFEAAGCCHTVTSVVLAVFNGMTNLDGGVSTARLFGWGPAAELGLGAVAAGTQFCMSTQSCLGFQPGMKLKYPDGEYDRNAYIQKFEDKHLKDGCRFGVKLVLALAASLPASIFSFTGLVPLLATVGVVGTAATALSLFVAGFSFIASTFSYYTFMQDGWSYLVSLWRSLGESNSCVEFSATLALGAVFGFLAVAAVLGRADAVFTLVQAVLQPSGQTALWSTALSGGLAGACSLPSFMLYTVGLYRLWDMIVKKGRELLGPELSCQDRLKRTSLYLSVLVISMAVAAPAALGAGAQAHDAILNWFGDASVAVNTTAWALFGAATAGSEAINTKSSINFLSSLSPSALYGFVNSSCSCHPPGWVDWCNDRLRTMASSACSYMPCYDTTSKVHHV